MSGVLDGGGWEKVRWRQRGAETKEEERGDGRRN